MTDINTANIPITGLAVPEGYQIVRTDFGVLIYGAAPITEISALAEVWSAEGLNFLAPGVAKALGAHLAITDNVEGWTQAVETRAEDFYPQDPQAQWFAGPHTGLSSTVIFSVLARPALANRAKREVDGEVPHDADDFSRCWRLVKTLEWEDRLPEVAKAHPQWSGLVEAWPKLSALFEESKALSEAGKKEESNRVWKQLNEAVREAKSASS